MTKCANNLNINSNTNLNTDLKKYPGGEDVLNILEKPFLNLINGKLLDADDHFDVLNPADNQILARAPKASIDNLDQAVSAAKLAFKTWRLDSEYRKSCIRLCVDRLTANIEQIALLLTLEQGKPLSQALGETKSAIAKINAVLSQEIPVDTFETKDKTTQVFRHPMGVVAGIAPWNYPVSIGVAKMFRPIAIGNTVVMKPASVTPLSSLYIAELVSDILPPGVLNVITGPGKIGESLVAHPDVRMVTFTGSVPVGKRIAEVAARDLTRVSLELGGNDASIVLADTDLDKYAEDIFWGAFRNSGQICIASKRLYIHEDIYEDLINRLVKIANTVKVGNGLDDMNSMGPVNNLSQLKLVEELVSDAKSHGGKVLCGGNRLPGDGYFYPPTIISNISEGVRLVDEEQFGPVLPVMKFKDIDEVISRVNSSRLGLAGSVWCGNTKQGQEIAKQIESGMVWVNHVLGSHPKAPFGGMKESGVGREGGNWGLELMSELQAVTLIN